MMCYTIESGYVHVCSDYNLYSVDHMDMLWFEDKSGYGVARHKNTHPWENIRSPANPNINTNRALNHVDELGLAEPALAEVTWSVNHDVRVGSRLIVRVVGVG